MNIVFSEPDGMGEVVREAEGHRHDDRVRRSEKSRDMETIDRGVGPTPVPSVDQRVPPYFGFAPYMADRRTAMMESGENTCKLLPTFRAGRAGSQSSR